MSEHDPMPDDPLPALMAAIDQMVAISPQLARAARGVFDAFKAEDFSDPQALYLTAVHLKDDPGSPP